MIGTEQDVSPRKLMPFGGIDTSQNELSLAETDSPNCRNVKLHPPGTMGKREGFVAYGTPGSGTDDIDGLLFLDKGPGLNRVLIAAKGGVFYRTMAATTPTWEVCNTSLPSLTGQKLCGCVGPFSELVGVSWVDRGACLFITDGYDTPRVERGYDAADVGGQKSLTQMTLGVYGAGGSPGIPWSGTGFVTNGSGVTTTETRDWADDPPTGFAMIGEGRDQRMLAFGFANDGSRIDASELAVPYNFLLSDYLTGAISSATDGQSWRVFKGDGDVVVHVIDMVDYIVVFKRRRTFIYSGTIGATLALKRILPVGLASRDSVMRFGNDIVWLSEMGQLHALSAVEQYGDLAYNRIGDPVRGIALDPENLHMACAYHDVEARRLVWFVPALGSTVNSLALVYYYDQPPRWTVFDGAYAQMNAAVVAYLASGAEPLIFGGNQSGAVVQLNSGSDDGGTAITMTRDTPWLDAGDIGAQDRLLALDIAIGSSGAADLQLSVANDLVETFTELGSVIRAIGTPTVGWDYARWDIDCWDVGGQALWRYEGIGVGNLFKLRFSCTSALPLAILGWRPLVIRKGRR